MKNANFRVYIFNIVKDFLSNHTLEELSQQVSSMKVTEECGNKIAGYIPVSYTHLTLPTIYSV